MQEGLYFETVGLTEEDHQRTGQYVTEECRQLESSAASLDDYLSSLEMCGDVRPIDDADLARVVQLLSKTNQFNLTTRRHSRDALLDLLALSGSIGLTLRLADRFGDHGLVAVVIVVPAGETATVEARIDILADERAASSAEQPSSFFFTAMLERCRTLGYRRLIGEYIPTKKNGLVADFYQQLGFNRLNSDERSGPSSFFALDLQKAVPPLSFIRQHPVLDGEVCPVGSGKPGG